MEKDFDNSVYDTDFKDQSVLENLKGWEKEEGEPVGEMSVYVVVDVEQEDGSFDHAFGTHRQMNIVGTLKSVVLVDSEGNHLDQDISELLTDKARERFEEKAQEDTSDEDFEPDYDRDDN